MEDETPKPQCGDKAAKRKKVGTSSHHSLCDYVQPNVAYNYEWLPM
jgi:hypothetical protein